MGRRGKLGQALLFLAAMIVAVAQAEAGSGGGASSTVGSVTPIGEDAFQAMLKDATGEKGGMKVQDGSVLRVELAAESTVLFFTTPSHPAHPSVVSVKVMREDDIPRIFTDGWHGGDRRAFEEWFTGFTRRSARLARKWNETN